MLFLLKVGFFFLGGGGGGLQICAEVSLAKFIVTPLSVHLGEPCQCLKTM